MQQRLSGPGGATAVRLCLAILALSLAPSLVRAQQPETNWPGLNVLRLPTVYVLDSTGHETEGKLLRLDPDALVILVDGAERRFEASSVRRIEKRDALRNGAIFGAITGALFGLIGSGLSDCAGDDPGDPCPGTRAALFLISTGTWAAIGLGIDALIPGRTTLYEAPTRQPSAGRVGSETPPFGRVALSVRLRW